MNLHKGDVQHGGEYILSLRVGHHFAQEYFLFDYNGPRNLNTEEGVDKIYSEHDEKTVYSSVQGQSGAGTSQRRENFRTTCRRV